MVALELKLRPVPQKTGDTWSCCVRSPINEGEEAREPERIGLLKESEGPVTMSHRKFVIVDDKFAMR